MHVIWGLLGKAPLGVSFDVRLGPDHEPSVCRGLDSLFIQQFQIPIPKAADSAIRT